MPCILVVDDDDTFRNMLERILKRGGYEVLCARDGVEALNLFEQRPTDLVLTDLIMPNKEGLETIVELRKKHPKLKIIAMSGGGRIDAKDYLTIATKCGVNATMSKPFTIDAILTTIKRVLEAA